MELVNLHILNPKVLHENQWIEVNPVPGALVINLGEVLQLISNDRFISVQHRVLARTGVPRIAVASFLRQQPPPPGNASRLYGPIKELLSEESPSIYREITVGRHDDLDYDTVYIAAAFRHGFSSFVPSYSLFHDRNAVS